LCAIFQPQAPYARLLRRAARKSTPGIVALGALCLFTISLPAVSEDALPAPEAPSDVRLPQPDSGRPEPGPAGPAPSPLLTAQAGTSTDSGAPPQVLDPAIPAKRAPTPAAPKYVDKLIDESLEGEDDGRSLEEREQGPQPLGRRLYAFEARRFERRSADSRYGENGVLLQHRRETLDYGDLSLDVLARESRDSGPAAGVYGSSQSGAQVQFHQFRHPLTSNLLMDNSAGVVRLGPNPLLGSSYRVQLPSSLASGAQSIVYRDQHEFRIFSGRIGRLEGAVTQSFEETSGEVSGVGYKQAFSPRWSAGVQLIDFKGNTALPEHRSAALAARFEDKSAGRQFSLHTLGDSRGARGHWADGLETAGLWQYRYGLYRLPFELRWAESNIGSDSQGVYVRSEYRTQINSLAIGGEFAESNLYDDAARSGAYTRTAFSTLFHRVSRDRFLNGSLSVSDRSGKSALPAAEDSRSTSASFGVGQRFPIGLSNFRVFASRTDASVNDARSYGTTWDHAWNTRGWQLATALSYDKSDVAGVESERRGASATFRSALAGIAAFDGGLQFTRTYSASGGDADNLSGNLNVNWTLSRRWSTRVQMLWNRTEVAGPLAAAASQDKSIFIALRGEDSSGLPYPRLGRETGGVGTGRIVGWVFFDENGDGVRQASERTAPGVIVYLDGRYSTTTDSDGKFEFIPVPTGTHTLRLSIERVPLPWGLHDESPRKVEVPLRDALILEFPLSRISQ
jgi:hypothetical protein